MSSTLYWQEKGKQRQSGRPILFLLILSFIFSCLLSIGTCSMSNSRLEGSVPDYETKQLLRKHLMTPFKFTVACSFFDTFKVCPILSLQTNPGSYRHNHTSLLASLQSLWPSFPGVDRQEPCLCPKASQFPAYLWWLQLCWILSL